MYSKGGSHMNARQITEVEGRDTFSNLVAFKWLMAGIGWWVDLTRLQSDRAYINECLQRALKSDSDLLRERSVELLGLRRGADGSCDTKTSPALMRLAF
jgi:hypothetical protein